MHIAHAILGHAVLIPLVFSLLAGLFLAVYRLDRNATTSEGFAAPLDHDLVERWNSRGAALTAGH